MLRRNTTEILTGLLVLAVAFGFLGYALAHSGQNRVGAGYTLYARFDNVAGLNLGAPVRLAGVQVGRVDSEAVDPKTYLANVGMTIRHGVDLPKDSSVTVSSESLLGGEYLAIEPGADETMLRPGETITITQGAVSLEQLLGKFIFSATNMVSAMGNAKDTAKGGHPGAASTTPPRASPEASPGMPPGMPLGASS
ncbi:MAG: outer membrane lipid asymmetry maintenance protein MlaD, partial [Acetobacteraceae bacterium]